MSRIVKSSFLEKIDINISIIPVLLLLVMVYSLYKLVVFAIDFGRYAYDLFSQVKNSKKQYKYSSSEEENSDSSSE